MIRRRTAPSKLCEEFNLHTFVALFGKDDFMSDLFSKFKGKVDEKVLKAKLNNAFDLIKSGNMDDLIKKINKIDKDELLEKLNEFDQSKLNDMNIDKNEISKMINSVDLENFSKALGDNGEEILKVLKSKLDNSQ